MCTVSVSKASVCLCVCKCAVMCEPLSTAFMDYLGKVLRNKGRILEGSSYVPGLFDGNDEPIYSPNSDNY